MNRTLDLAAAVAVIAAGVWYLTEPDGGAPGPDSAPMSTPPAGTTLGEAAKSAASSARQSAEEAGRVAESAAESGAQAGADTTGHALSDASALSVEGFDAVKVKAMIAASGIADATKATLGQAVDAAAANRDLIPETVAKVKSALGM